MSGDEGPDRGAGLHARWLGLGPGVRVWRSRRWDYTMLVLGALMLVSNAFVVAAGTDAPGGVRPWAGPQAVVGFGLALIAVSDLLGERGAGRAAMALRVVALACFAGVFAAWMWAAAHGSGTAAFALAFGAACAALALLIAWARR